MECEIKKILSTTWVPDECIQAFEGVFEITCPQHNGDDFSYEKVINMVEHFDALFVLKDFMCGRKIINAGENLKVIASHGIGYANIDIDYATEKGVFVLNTPIGFCETTADFSISLIMSIIRSLSWYDKEFNNAKSEIADSLNTKNTFLYGKTLGIVGFGGVGKAIACKASAFGMKIIYYDIVRSSIEDEEDLFATYVGFEELLEKSDIVTCHIPMIESGKYLMNIDAFRKMKDTAFFINSTGGHVVSEFDLLEALRKKEIRAAAIDIHEFQSKVSGDIVSLENVVIIPNVSSVAQESRVNMYLEIFNSMKVLAEGKYPDNVVNNQLCSESFYRNLKEEVAEEEVEKEVSPEEELAHYNEAINEALVINDAELNDAEVQKLMNRKEEILIAETLGEEPPLYDSNDNEEVVVSEEGQEGEAIDLESSDEIVGSDSADVVDNIEETAQTVENNSENMAAEEIIDDEVIQE